MPVYTQYSLTDCHLRAVLKYAIQRAMIFNPPRLVKSGRGVSSVGIPIYCFEVVVGAQQNAVVCQINGRCPWHQNPQLLRAVHPLDQGQQVQRMHATRIKVGETQGFLPAVTLHRIDVLHAIGEWVEDRFEVRTKDFGP